MINVLNDWSVRRSAWEIMDDVRGRLKDLAGKTIGLYSSTYKMAARPISESVDRQLQAKFPTVKFTYFDFCASMDVDESEEKADFYEWVKGVDAVVAAVGD